jgi:copper(I)-binding protein
VTRTTSLLAILTLTGLVGCGGGSADGDEIVEVDGLAVIEAWARPTPTGASEAAIYITIENRDAPDDRLIGVSSERCMVMAPHLTTIANDIASMTETDEDDDVLGLETGGRVVMEPNGLHAMCLGLTDPLASGDEFDVVLQFHAHDPIAVPVTVRQR